MDCDRCAISFREIILRLYLLELHPTAMYYARSSSGRHWHIVVYLRERLPILAALFVQLYLGSDPERERHGFIRAYHYGRRDRLVQILFERKL